MQTRQWEAQQRNTCKEWKWRDQTGFEAVRPQSQRQCCPMTCECACACRSCSCFYWPKLLIFRMSSSACPPGNWMTSLISGCLLSLWYRMETDVGNFDLMSYKKKKMIARSDASLPFNTDTHRLPLCRWGDLRLSPFSKWEVPISWTRSTKAALASASRMSGSLREKMSGMTMCLPKLATMPPKHLLATLKTCALFWGSTPQSLQMATALGALKLSVWVWGVSRYATNRKSLFVTSMTAWTLEHKS